MVDQPTTLVVNADDFGLTKGMNQGIVWAFQQGILTSTSLMPNGTAFDDAVALAKENPNLGVGVHFSLVDEIALTRSKLVDRDGRLPGSYMAFVKGLATGRFGTADIKAEMDAQLEKFIATGMKPTHLDSHQHLHLLPSIFAITLEYAKKLDVKYVRIPLERGGIGPSPLTARGIQTSFLSILCRIARRRARAAGVSFVDSFWGLGVSGNMTEDNLLQTIKRLRPGFNEIMCHPGIPDDYAQETYQWGYNWQSEAAALIAKSVILEIELAGIQLRDFASFPQV